MCSVFHVLISIRPSIIAGFQIVKDGLWIILRKELRDEKLVLSLPRHGLSAFRAVTMTLMRLGVGRRRNSPEHRNEKFEN